MSLRARCVRAQVQVRQVWLTCMRKRMKVSMPHQLCREVMLGKPALLWTSNTATRPEERVTRHHYTAFTFTTFRVYIGHETEQQVYSNRQTHEGQFIPVRTEMWTELTHNADNEGHHVYQSVEDLHRALTLVPEHTVHQHAYQECDKRGQQG